LSETIVDLHFFGEDIDNTLSSSVNPASLTLDGVNNIIVSGFGTIADLVAVSIFGHSVSVTGHLGVDVTNRSRCRGSLFSRGSLICKGTGQSKESDS